MAERPSGTVTFLFTDVEGSTRLWAADREGMSASLAVHDRVIRESVESSGGVVFATGGDSFAAAFTRASEAVAAAVAAQAALSTLTWPGPALRVRMGVHLGEAEERGGDYFGPVVNAAARVEAAGHGGQVLLTEPVRAVVDVDVVTDLGVHRLRDLPEPVRLFQVGAGHFAPLRGVTGDRDSLPIRRTRLLGRDTEVGTLIGLFDSARLVTIVGPGGIGKTSLAIETAGKVSSNYAGGAHFVDLAATASGDDTIAAIRSALRLGVSSEPYEQLVGFLTEHESLLVIDNCEHVIDDVAGAADRLLSDVPAAAMLATSREHLDIDGERILRLGPLPSSAGSASVRLFVERAGATYPDFDPSVDDIERIAVICGRLDGLPLAIELAAGRAATMSVSEIESRLDDRFSLLAGGRRGRLRRQQTLRAAIEWSIALLDDEEAELLARLSVYVGGFDLDGATAVAGQIGAVSADLVGSLVSKSLIQRVDDRHGYARYRMLETVREWGSEELTRRELLREARDLHAQRFVDTFSALDIYEQFSPMTGLAWEHDIADIVRAIEYLRDADPVGAAVIAAPHALAITTAGHGDLAVEVTLVGKQVATASLVTRLSVAHLIVAAYMMTIDSGDEMDFPPDDGSEEWGFLIGGPGHDFAGVWGFSASIQSPLAVVEAHDQTLDPPNDRHSLWVRSYAVANACIAQTQLGRYDDAIESFALSRELLGRAGAGHHTPSTAAVDLQCATVASMCLDRDIRNTTIAVEARRYDRTVFAAVGSLPAMSAITEAPPCDWPTRLAQTARAHCHGRLPDEESSYLAMMACLAIRDGDLDRAQYLNETVAPRSPICIMLKRYNDIRIQGLPIETMDDEQHHLANIGQTTDPTNERRTLNRRKMLEEVKRRLD